MSENNTSIVQLNHDEPELKARSFSQLILRRFLRHRMAVAGLIILVGMILYIGLGSIIYSEADANFNNPRIKLEAPSSQHLFGTDTVGRDILARTIYGGQISLLIGLASMIMSVTIGTTVGMSSGYYGGIIDAVLMRITEALLSVPVLLLLLVMSKFFSGKISDVQFLGRTFSGSVIVIIVIIGMTSWMGLARIVRSMVLSLRETDFVLAARAMGASNFRIITRHILPNILAPVTVAATLGVAGAILYEAYISFLGLGVRPPTATWGNMLESAGDYLEQAPWLWFWPGLFIVLTLLGINFVGDGLRDAFDPYTDKSG
jgi:peptide/nickel transport system permease protein